VTKEVVEKCGKGFETFFLIPSVFDGNSTLDTHLTKAGGYTDIVKSPSWCGGALIFMNQRFGDDLLRPKKEIDSRAVSAGLASLRSGLRYYLFVDN
jgi:hypothetical protein